MAQKGAHAGVVIPREAGEDQAREIMYKAAPTCDVCGEHIENIELASAVFFKGAGIWKLCHTVMCTAQAIMGPFGGKIGRRVSSPVFN